VSNTYALLGEVLTTAGPTRAAVVIRDGKIDAVLRDPRPGALPDERRELAGLLCPGFIDLQINGAFGADIGPDPEAIRTLVTKLPATGVTSFLPTLISSPPELYEEFLVALEESATEEGARVLGAHLEGPFLAPERRGRTTPTVCDQ
jgi:N-acetylglucosamine-6-phosphate deacetylase